MAMEAANITVASSTLKLIQPVVPPTVSYSPPRIVLDNIADQLIALSEDVMPSLPEP
jgi:hypothetical protein